MFTFCAKKNNDRIFWSNLMNKNFAANTQVLNDGYYIDTSCNDSGRTHLMRAVLLSSKHDIFDILNFLIDNGANINKQDRNGNSALMYAAQNSSTRSSLEIVNYLLKKSADPNLMNIMGLTALMLSSLYSNTTSSVATVTKLIAYGANVDMQDVKGWTALMYASIYVPNYSQMKTINILITAGANPFIENGHKNTAIRQLKDTESTKIINTKLKVLHHTEKPLIESSKLLQDEMERRIRIKTMTLIRTNLGKKYKQMSYLVATKASDNNILKITECPLCEKLMTDPVTLNGITFCNSCIDEYCETNNYCPITGQLIDNKNFFINNYMNEIITQIRLKNNDNIFKDNL